MLRRLVSTVAIMALMAPAIAVCAGSSEPVQKSANHDCCPKEDVAADAGSAAPSAMTESCCRMSDDAGQRVPSPASRLVTAPQAAVTVPAWFRAVVGRTSATAIVTSPHSSDHVARHLLLSVLIV